MSENKVTYHHLNNSQGQRVLWLLEELRLASASTPNPFTYNLVLHKRETSGPRLGRSPQSLFTTHPLGKCPQIVTPSGRVIIESAACIKYLIETHDTTNSFRGDPSSDPKGEIDSIRDEMLTSFAGASLPIPMMTDMFMQILTILSPFFIRPIFRAAHTQFRARFAGPEVHEYFKWLEGELGEKEYFMGGKDPAKADFMLSWPADFGPSIGLVDFGKPEFKRLKVWHERCQARPAWKSGLEKGNGYELGLPK